MTNPWQIVTVLSTILGMMGLAFTLGYNWRRVTVLEQSFAQSTEATKERQEEIDRTYARKDLIEVELRSVRSRLDYMSKQLSELLHADRPTEPA
jgi:Tfp pilus assembly protein PilO